MTSVPPELGTQGWLSWHIHLAADASGADLLTGLVAGPLAGLVAEQLRAGRIRRWFFIRYWEGGPHLRLRILPAPGDHRAALDAAVRSAFHDLPADGHDPAAYLGLVRFAARASLLTDPSVDPRLAAQVRPPGVYGARYTPETDRYGAGAELAASEQVFMISSDLALRCARAGLDDLRRRLTGLEVVLKTAWLAAADEPDAWLVRYAQFWRDWNARSPAEVFPADAVAERAAAWAAALCERGGITAPALTGRHSPVTAWAAALADLLDPAGGVTPFRAGHRGSLCISHSHMTLNRLGLLVHEEFLLIETARLLATPSTATS
ncbi:lantibiotic dehydratase C-terminal domain-containing protein [Streptomyces sp. NPDC054834]